MNIRRYKPEDYQEIAAWYTERNIKFLPPEFLPADGFVAHNGTVLFGAAWIYFSTTGHIAWLAWLATAPDLPPKLSYAAVKMLSDFAAHEIARRGPFLMLANSSYHGYTRMLDKQGFESDGKKDLMFKFVYNEEV